MSSALGFFPRDDCVMKVLQDVGTETSFSSTQKGTTKRLLEAFEKTQIVATAYLFRDYRPFKSTFTFACAPSFSKFDRSLFHSPKKKETFTASTILILKKIIVMSRLLLQCNTKKLVEQRIRASQSYGTKTSYLF